MIELVHENIKAIIITVFDTFKNLEENVYIWVFFEED